MSDALAKAEAAASEAAVNSAAVQVALAAVELAKLAQNQQQPAAPPPDPATSQFSVGKWIAIGLAGSVCAISLALSAIAVAVGAVAVTCCLLVLRSMWRDYQRKG
ncbi:hypothetical protein OHB41_25895 [Streptomyces sp. NBC_01571]|uniref:hypothetical protein n=1 Tax=Streptomyces sp. NBC_01571 TaxID=2975883 RepID=UPI00224CD1C5|nr:hypothetical protein [Streptomyces sp. NBC_01571]MCX4576544.1 hypothetical protein [Streptomyces sp. NBC_01571]